MSPSERPIIIYDGVCRLCAGLLGGLLRVDSVAGFELVMMQSDRAQTLVRQFQIQASLDRTFVLINDNQVYYRSQAALKVAGLSGWPLKLLLVFTLVPVSWRDRCYNWVARNRYRWFGRSETCIIVSPGNESRTLKKSS